MAVIVESGYALPQPDRARIGWQDMTDAFSATSAASEHPAISARTWQTYERWKPSDSPATLTATIPSKLINYIGIGAHSLTLADAVTIEVETGGDWVAVLEDYVAPDNEALMLLIEPRLCTGVRMTVTYDDTAPSIGKVAAGYAMTMQRPLYGGHAPIMLTRNTVRTVNVSESGEWLGSTVLRQGRTTEIAWQHLTALWYRTNFEPFVWACRARPFFIAWRPNRFVDCAYAMLTEDPRPSNMGIRDYMSVSIAISAYSDNTKSDASGFGPYNEPPFSNLVGGAGIIDQAVNEEWP